MRTFRPEKAKSTAFGNFETFYSHSKLLETHRNFGDNFQLMINVLLVMIYTHKV